MEKNNARNKNQKRNANRKNKKRKQQTANGLQNNQNNIQKNEIVLSVPIKTASMSPRPSNFQINNKNVDFKRSSGSEYEDLQTPSAEYDIKIEDFDKNKEMDISPDLDKTWDELGSFKNCNLEEIVVQDRNNCKETSILEVSYTSDVPEDIDEKCNGSVSFCHTYNKTLDIPLVKYESIDNYVIDNMDISMPPDEDEVALIGDDTQMEVAAEDGVNDNDDSVSNANYVMCVNQFFKDIDDDRYGYPVEEPLVKENECNATQTDETDNPSFDDTLVVFQEMWTKNDDEEAGTTKNYESEAENDMLDFVCTEENLTEETLSVPCISLDVAQEPYIQKSMTLKAQHTDNSYKQSATSITIVTSISDDNIALSIDKDIKSSKKNKTGALKIYRNIVKKFKKAKTPEKESAKKESCENNLSVRSGDLIKDSEIESNQSLKSNIDSDNNSLIVVMETGINEPNHRFREENIVNEARKLSESNVEHGTIKNEKSKSFINILKKKHKGKKDPEVTTPDEIIHSEIGGGEIIQERSEIDAKVMDEFDETVKSLMRDNENEVKAEDCVIVNGPMKELHTDNCMDPVVDDEDDDGEDHLYPDAITATKILGSKPLDVPYIDDPVISKLDYVSIYNGESKRIRISAQFFVPRASTETLFMPGESMKDCNVQKSLINNSPCRRKRVLGNFLGCMSRGR